MLEMSNFKLALLLVLLVCTTGVFYGQDEKSAVQNNVAQLLDGLAKSAVSGAPVSQFFSPSTRISQRESIDSLQKKGFTSFEFTNYSLKDLQLEDARHATLPATVRWSAHDEEASTTTRLHFVKEQSSWYFADAGFWEVSFLWFAPMIAYGACYGCGAVVMYWHSNRQVWVNTRGKFRWQVLALVPLSIFFYFVRKPWAAKAAPDAVSA
ncbi:MAG: hypothetical protein ABSA80_09875 [Terriglobales bacterium]